jgi:fructose-1-phosphate kinase PfkB-like protein
MIRSICLNPVIDRVYFINQFQAGGLYRDNRPKFYSGGKGVNVAKVLAALGETCVIYGFIAGSAGQNLKADLVSRGIQSRLLEIPGDTRTTINIIDNEHHEETEILELGPTADEIALQSLLEQLTATLAEVILLFVRELLSAELNWTYTIPLVKFVKPNEHIVFWIPMGKSCGHRFRETTFSPNRTGENY